ncbi:MAG: T9SS type A sorting domain-containing protein, partial [Ignavibacteria bacterium]|nr:T9SS type A sorting domain-containing protein [Ignavibacteria bacterium]
DLSENNPPRIVAKADGGQYATSLSYLPMADKHRFYGTVDDNRVFVFDVNRNQTSSDPIIQIETNHNSALYFYPTAVLCTKDSQTILLADCHHLWVYNTSQINYSNNYFPPTDTINSTFYGQFFHLWCGAPNTESGYVPQLLEGNDSLIYGFYNGTVFHFDLKATDIRQSLKKYTIPGYNENTLGLEISVIAEDGTNRKNKDIYIGTRSGKIFILTNNIQSGITDSAIPSTIELLDNYPNPFNGSTIIDFRIPERRNINLSVYDVLGRKITTLADGEFRAGIHRVTFTSISESGISLSSGIYYYVLTSEKFVTAKKLLLLR